MSWEVSLVGDNTDLEMLAISFKGPDIAIAKQGDGFIITSPEYENLNDAEKIKEYALKIIELLNGSARLALDSRAPIRFGGVIYRHEDGHRDIYVTVDPAVAHCRVLSPSVTITHLNGTSETYRPADSIRNWIKITSRDEAVEKVLRLMSKGIWDWVNLYRIYEIISADCGSLKKIASLGWATSKALKLFKHTANHPEAIGFEARHGSLKETPPARPMTFSEAKSLILSVVQLWLASKST